MPAIFTNHQTTAGDGRIRLGIQQSLHLIQISVHGRIGTRIPIILVQRIRGNGNHIQLRHRRNHAIGDAGKPLAHPIRLIHLKIIPDIHITVRGVGLSVIHRLLTNVGPVNHALNSILRDRVRVILVIPGKLPVTFPITNVEAFTAATVSLQQVGNQCIHFRIDLRFLGRVQAIVIQVVGPIRDGKARDPENIIG